jgi:ribosome maturation factor RimP
MVARRARQPLDHDRSTTTARPQQESDDMAASDAQLKSGLSEPLAALGVDVEAVEVQKAGRRHVVRIVVDRDGGVDLDLVAAVSQRASEVLDQAPLADLLPGPFVLEVTSPGVDRPLTEPRHWRRALTRLVAVTRTDGSTLTGRITSVPDGGAVVVTTDHGDVTIALSDVQLAVVQVEFNRASPETDEPETDEPETEDEGQE